MRILNQFVPHPASSHEDTTLLKGGDRFSHHPCTNHWTARQHSILLPRSLPHYLLSPIIGVAIALIRITFGRHIVILNSSTASTYSCSGVGDSNKIMGDSPLGEVPFDMASTKMQGEKGLWIRLNCSHEPGGILLFFLGDMVSPRQPSTASPSATLRR